MAQIVAISAGNVQYSKDEAKIRIADLIEELKQAEQDGAEFIVGLSGNYRGAQYVRLGLEVEHLEEREVDEDGYDLL